MSDPISESKYAKLIERTIEDLIEMTNSNSNLYFDEIDSLLVAISLLKDYKALQK